VYDHFVDIRCKGLIIFIEFIDSFFCL